MIGIYKITSPTKKVYIGQSTDIEKRFKIYKSLNCKSQTILYRSLLKYGIKKHKFEILCECSENELNDKERYYQDLYSVLNNKGMNCRLTSSKCKSGKLSDLTKEKISLKKSGVKHSINHTLLLVKNSARKRAVINISDNTIYKSAKIACRTTEYNYYTFIAKLSGKRKNDTNFKYL